MDQHRTELTEQAETTVTLVTRQKMQISVMGLGEMHMSERELTYRVKPLEMTSVSCTRRRALRDSPVSVLPLWTKLWSCVAWAWTALCMQPCFHSMTPLRPTQPSRARPHGAAASDHRPPDVAQRPSSTAAKPISPAMSLVRGGTGGNLDYYNHYQ